MYVVLVSFSILDCFLHCYVFWILTCLQGNHATLKAYVGEEQEDELHKAISRVQDISLPKI